jgi:hypothetical protein
MLKIAHQKTYSTTMTNPINSANDNIVKKKKWVAWRNFKKIENLQKSSQNKMSILGYLSLKKEKNISGIIYGSL